jgi:CRISPR-associated endonuclease Cas3-HD
MLPTLSRLFAIESAVVKNAVEVMIVCHDIGKLSRQWQTYIQPESERKHGPPHATLGAAYLLLNPANSNLDSLHNGAALAILMHHTDSGLAQGNLEHPAEDAINRGLVDYGSETIRWAEGADGAFEESHGGFCSDMLGWPLASVTLSSLEKMALNLRLWSRCPRSLEQHQHRIQALSLHHVIKICDWRAASRRPQETHDEDGDVADTPNKNKWHDSILRAYLDGGILP